MQPLSTSHLSPAQSADISLSSSEDLGTAGQEFIEFWIRLPGGSDYIADRDLGGLTDRELKEAFLVWLEANPAVLDLETIVLGGWPLHQVPSAIRCFEHLRELYIQSPVLTEIPPVIFKLTHLQKLQIRAPLQRVSPDIALLQNLRYLLIYDASLGKLPSEIGSLKLLETLDVSRCGLTELPLEVGYLPLLSRIFASENSIAKLPATVGLCQGLESLILSWNRLTEIPPELWSLKKLRHLLLNENQLTLFPIPQEEVPLFSWNLDGNLLTGISPQLLQQLPHLRQLYLRRNNIPVLPNSDHIEEIVY